MATSSQAAFSNAARFPSWRRPTGEALEIALRSCGHLQEGGERIVRILDTLHLEEVYVSSALVEELSDREGIEVIEPPSDLFDGNGDLSPF